MGLYECCICGKRYPRRDVPEDECCCSTRLSWDPIGSNVAEWDDELSELDSLMRERPFGPTAVL
jgi:hypothetical protein